MRTQGARSNDKNLANEPADHALGRSRGGLSTKIHALTDTFCCPLTLLLSPGQAGDNPYLAPLLDAHRAHDTAAFRLLADKAYSHPSTRKNLRERRISHTIPERRDQIRRRKAKGSDGGRPPAFDKDRYRGRNTVERGFGRLKQWRDIATRYDKYATTFLGGVLFAALVIHHRVRK
jgi:putative transposase|uniref:Putative transposase n=1 Tax=Rhodococcus erythropolis TaxID=1833 RepID=Q6XMY3_RHOER|nr:putative transposase [Rhodococcus erythropolis]